MALDDDLPLHPDSGRSDVDGRSSHWWLWAAAALVIVAAIVAAVIVWRGTPEPAGTTATTGTEEPAAAAPARDIPLGPDVIPVDLPPLDGSDGVVRELVATLSASPEVTAWLATDGLIRNFVTAVENVSEGKSPARHLKVLAPRERFRVARRGDRLVADARSFQRYDGLARTVAVLDANGVARLYATLRPRLQDAYRELGHPDGNIDAAVEKAIAHLLAAPAPTEEAALVDGVVSYRFTDPRLEGASPAQKQLMRMGPRNQALVQDKLREIATALGI